MTEMMASKLIKVQPRPLPAELLNEMFASLPFENAFGILAKMPNLLLARNVRKMLKSVQMAMSNKWNEADCGPEMTISEGGLVVNYKYKYPLGNINCVRAISPIPSFINSNAKKPSIAAYFEVQIFSSCYGIGIGFCTKQFLLENGWLGLDKNSVGIYSGIGLIYRYDNKFEHDFLKDFKPGDVIGVGIVRYPANSPMKFFATWNGELLGTIELPTKFTTLQLFPALTLNTHYNSIRANFHQEKWRFNLSKLLLK